MTQRSPEQRRRHTRDTFKRVALVYADTLERAQAWTRTDAAFHSVIRWVIRYECISARSHDRARGLEADLLIEVDPMTDAAAQSILPALAAHRGLRLRAAADETHPQEPEK